MALTKQGYGTRYGPIWMFTREELDRWRAQPKKGPGGRPPKARRDAGPGEPGVAAPPGETCAPAAPLQLRPVVLGHGEPDHLALEGADETLCGERVHSGAYQPAAYDGRRACRTCRRVAKERGLSVKH